MAKEKTEEEIYLDFIRENLKTYGIELADTSNKIALDQKKISTDLYLKAARIIVDAYLAKED